MSEQYLAELRPEDGSAKKQQQALLAAEGISLDPHLDYSCGIFEDGELIATGSCFGATLRCLAVDSSHRGEGLLNTVVSHLLGVQLARGNRHVFLYTKPQYARFFAQLGFYEVERVPGRLVFMENKRDGFARYLENLKAESAGFELCGAAAEERRYCETRTAACGTEAEGTFAAVGSGAESAAGFDEKNGMGFAAASAAKPVSAIVLHANPFTLGHRYLIKTAAAKSRVVHLFAVSEEYSPIPFAVRRKLTEEGCRDIPNICLHSCGSYIISSAVFPSYFIKSSEDLSRVQAKLDARIFVKIAKALDIDARYLGSEPFSTVTALYNETLQQVLPEGGVRCFELPRLESRRNDGSEAVSASRVRLLLKEGRTEEIRPLVPESTYRYFASAEAAPVLEALSRQKDVVHH